MTKGDLDGIMLKPVCSLEKRMIVIAILILAGIYGLPFLALAIGSHVTAAGFSIMGLVLVAVVLYSGKYSAFDTSDGPLFMGISHASGWFLLWLLLGFIKANRPLIDPYADSIKNFFFK